MTPRSWGRSGRIERRNATNRAIRLRADRLAEELELLIDGATKHAICMLDTDGHIEIWNKGAERIFGWTEEEVLGQHIRIFFGHDDIADGKPDLHLAQARANGKLEDRGWRVRKDGSRFLAGVIMTRIDATGRRTGFAKVVRDVTEIQAHADAIEASEMHLRSILATVPDAMVVIDDHGIIVSFSATAEQTFGYSQDEAVGQDVSVLMGSSDHGALADYLAHYRATGERRIIGAGRRVVGRRKDGSPFPLELSIGEAIGGGKRVFTAFIRDLTERDEAEARLQELQAELLHVTRVNAMGTMASTLAHELNQPLTAVANYVQTSNALLETSGDSNRELVREALAEAGEEALRAGRIVRRLREFVARGEVTRSAEPIPKLIEDSSLLGMAGARERGIVRRLDLDPALGPVLIDPVQIQQVLINLIRNAVQAMAPMGAGEVRIAARGEGEFVRITVADTGAGLAPEVCDQLFQAFVSTKADGMGLGLSICRTIVEAHGGKIWAESPPASGAMFHFTVPRAITENIHG